MGLFTNNKKPCPICGEGTPRLLATEIAGDIPICSDCSFKISMKNIQVGALSVDGLKAHLVKREENASYLKDTFRPDQKIPIGFTSLNIDEANKTFTIPLNICGDTKNPPVFKFEELLGYDLYEESSVIESFNKGEAAPQIAPIVYSPFMQMNYNNNNNNNQTKPQSISRGFKLKLYLSNPCWDQVESSGGSVMGTEMNFQREYNGHLIELRKVTTALARMMGAVPAGAPSQSNSNSVVEDLKKFKELLDGGIITQEEFDAKKKQLLKI